MDVFVFTGVCPFFLVQGKCGCMRMEMVVNTICNPNLVLAPALCEPWPHITSFWGVWFMQCAQCLCSSQANSGSWKNPGSNSRVQREKEESVHYPGQNAAVRVEIIVVASSVTALGWLKKEENPIFDPCWLAALKSFASMFFLFLIINLFGKRCHACLNFKTDVNVSSSPRACHFLYWPPFFFAPSLHIDYCTLW